MELWGQEMRNTSLEGGAERSWQAYVSADADCLRAQRMLTRARTILSKLSPESLYERLEQALHRVGERRAALHLLLSLDETIPQRLFPALIDLASVGHKDIQLVRKVITAFDKEWLERNLPDQIKRILQPSATYEEYRRLAELLVLLQSPLIRTLTEQAARSSDPDIREVADDFRPID